MIKLLGLYFKQRKKAILAFLLFGAVFAASFWLYHIPIQAIAYPLMLCSLLGIALLIPDFLMVRNKHLQLVRLQVSNADILPFPACTCIEDKDYQEIIHVLKKEQANLQAVMSARYTDMIDYYTVWVHQIKTPIAAMRLILQNEDSASSRKLSSELFRIEQYVEMVLAFLRLGSTSTDYMFKEYDLGAIIRRSVKKFASEFISRKIHLDYQPISKTVVTDEKWLAFVLEQILSNALKYTRSGSVKIYMHQDQTLCIQDTGIGIAPEDLPRIFEKGYTGYNGRQDQKASGLGLYLCKRICSNLGHTISAKSSPGNGTTICIGLKQYSLEKE